MGFLSRIGVLTPLAIVILILVILNVLLSLGNQSLRQDVNEGQQMIAQTIQIEALNREIVGVLAGIAFQEKDKQLMELLAAHGISFAPPPPAEKGIK